MAGWRCVCLHCQGWQACRQSNSPPTQYLRPFLRRFRLSSRVTYSLLWRLSQSEKLFGKIFRCAT